MSTTKIRKLPIQALSRKEAGLMSTLVADPGMVFVSVDLVSGEPTVTTHYSQDVLYRYASFDGIGVAPHYAHFNEHYVLKIDDIYLMTMSVSPFGKQRMQEAFNAKYDGLTFAEQWLKDSEVIKKVLKKERQLHKILALGLSYSMGPKKLVQTAYENGYVISFADAKKFFKLYWSLFDRVAQFGKLLQVEYKIKGFIVNQFGYRLVPEKEHTCLNYTIQSSVSGLINLISYTFFQLAPWVELVSVIHDELLLQVNADRIDEAKQCMEDAVAYVNKILNWSVNVRTGWVVGSNLYTAK